VRYLSIATFACILSLPSFVLAGENHHTSKDASFERLRAQVLEHAAARQQQFLALKDTDTTSPDNSIVDSELKDLTNRIERTKSAVRGIDKPPFKSSIVERYVLDQPTKKSPHKAQNAQDANNLDQLELITGLSRLTNQQTISSAVQDALDTQPASRLRKSNVQSN
jgi:hypothetical protein